MRPPRVWVDANPGIGAYFCLPRLGEDMNWHAKHVNHALIAWGARGRKLEFCRPDQYLRVLGWSSLDPSLDPLRKLRQDVAAEFCRDAANALTEIDVK